MTKYLMRNKVLFIIVSDKDIKYNNDDMLFSGDENVMTITLTNSNNLLSRNQIKLKAISELQDNWDGYGAAPLVNSVIIDANDFLLKLLKQPEIFPTADGTIQMEYEKDNGDYLEIQFSDKPTCEVYMSKNRTENYFTIERTPENFNGLINNFYGCLF